MRLQDIVDDLASTLARSVVVNDLDYRPIVASAQEDDIDPMRATSLLKRGTPEPIREYLEGLRIRQLAQPAAVSLSPFGGRERLAVPVRGASGTVAILWLITGGHPPLTAADYRAIEAAGTLIADALEREAAERDGESELAPGDLLATDEAVSRKTFRQAVERRWFTPGAATSAVALRLRRQPGDIELRGMLQRLNALRRPAVIAPGLRQGMLIAVGRTADLDAVVDAVAAETSSAGFAPTSIGTAALEDSEARLVHAADRAVLAARIASRVPQTGGRGDIADLRVWALLDSVSAELDQLRLFSPAAAALCDGDATQRETVETYLEVAGNVRAACELLHIHRTTLYYRLDNLPEMVRAALDDGPARSTLHLCLKLARYHEAAVNEVMA